MINPKERAIIAKVQDYLGLCLGCGDEDTLFIATTPEERAVAELFLNARLQISGLKEIVDHSSSQLPHKVISRTGKDRKPLAVWYEIQRREGQKLGVTDNNLTNWKRLIEEYGGKHAVGFIDRKPGELPWRIAFIGLNQKNQLVYGHGPGTTMEHMAGHFMIDYAEAAKFGKVLVDKLEDPEVVGYLVQSDKGTNYLVLRDEKTKWHNDLMPRPYIDSMTQELIGDVGNIPGGEVFEEVSKARYLSELGIEIPVMQKRPAYGTWVADLSVGSMKKSLKSSGAIASFRVGIDSTDKIMPQMGGEVTSWSCTDPEIEKAINAEFDGDPYVAKEGLIVQEPLAFGFNPKARAETDDLLEGEKAFALHAAPGGVLSHVDMLASLDGVVVSLVKGGNPLIITNVEDLLACRPLGGGYKLEKLLVNGEYQF